MQQQQSSTPLASGKPQVVTEPSKQDKRRSRFKGAVKKVARRVKASAKHGLKAVHYYLFIHGDDPTWQHYKQISDGREPDIEEEVEVEAISCLLAILHPVCILQIPIFPAVEAISCLMAILLPLIFYMSTFLRLEAISCLVAILRPLHILRVDLSVQVEKRWKQVRGSVKLRSWRVLSSVRHYLSLADKSCIFGSHDR